MPLSPILRRFNTEPETELVCRQIDFNQYKHQNNDITLSLSVSESIQNENKSFSFNQALDETLYFSFEKEKILRQCNFKRPKLA